MGERSRAAGALQLPLGIHLPQTVGGLSLSWASLSFTPQERQSSPRRNSACPQQVVVKIIIKKEAESNRSSGE